MALSLEFSYHHRVVGVLNRADARHNHTQSDDSGLLSGDGELASGVEVERRVLNVDKDAVEVRSLCHPGKLYG